MFIIIIIKYSIGVDQKADLSEKKEKLDIF